MLTQDERHSVMSETMKMKVDGLEFWYGCTGPSTEQTIDYCKFAAAAGADGAIVAAPPYICAPEDDITDYFLEVADASPIPVGIYNNPPRVKTDLSHTAILRLAQHPNTLLSTQSTAPVAQLPQPAGGGGRKRGLEGFPNSLSRRTAHKRYAGAAASTRGWKKSW